MINDVNRRYISLSSPTFIAINLYNQTNFFFVSFHFVGAESSLQEFITFLFIL